MESVNYEYFDSENDYSKNPNATKHRSFNVSRGDFSKYAILNGFYGKKLISRDARKFYLQITLKRNASSATAERLFHF